MRKSRASIWPILALFVLAHCTANPGQSTATQEASAIPPVPETKTNRAGAMAGIRQRISRAYEIQIDCTSAGTIHIGLQSPPTHGHVETEYDTAFSDFDPPNPRTACNTKRTPGTSVYYTADPGFTG